MIVWRYAQCTVCVSAYEQLIEAVLFNYCGLYRYWSRGKQRVNSLVPRLQNSHFFSYKGAKRRKRGFARARREREPHTPGAGRVRREKTTVGFPYNEFVLTRIPLRCENSLTAPPTFKYDTLDGFIYFLFLM